VFFLVEGFVLDHLRNGPRLP